MVSVQKFTKCKEFLYTYKFLNIWYRSKIYDGITITYQFIGITILGLRPRIPASFIGFVSHMHNVQLKKVQHFYAVNIQSSKSNATSYAMQ